jgi:hypothetical protein
MPITPHRLRSSLGTGPRSASAAQETNDLISALEFGIGTGWGKVEYTATMAFLPEQCALTAGTRDATIWANAQIVQAV